MPEEGGDPPGMAEAKESLGKELEEEVEDLGKRAYTKGVGWLEAVERIAKPLVAVAAVLVPFAIAFVSNTVAVRQRESEDKTLEMDRVEKVVTYFTSEKSSDRLMGVYLTRAWVQSGGIPSSLLLTMSAIMRNDDDPEVALAAYQALQALSGESSKLDPEHKNIAVEALNRAESPRVHLYVTEAEKDATDSYLARLAKAGAESPEVDFQSAPTIIRVRLFSSDETFVQKIRDAFADLKIQVQEVNLSGKGAIVHKATPKPPAPTPGSTAAPAPSARPK